MHGILKHEDKRGQAGVQQSSIALAQACHKSIGYKVLRDGWLCG